MAPNHPVRQLALQLGTEAKFLSFDPATYDGPPPPIRLPTIRVMSNLADYLQLRLTRLAQANCLDLANPKFENLIWLAFGVDKGAGTTKFSITILNVATPNSINNLVFAGIYDGPDSYDHLGIALRYGGRQRSLLSQLNTIIRGGLYVGQQHHHVRLFVVADMMALCGLYGHKGPSSTFPCLLCRVPMTEMRRAPAATSPDLLRTVDELKEHGRAYIAGAREGRTDLQLSRQFYSIRNEPILQVPLDHIVPSPLHLILGLACVLITAVEERCRDLGGDWKKKLLDAYNDIKVDRRPFYQKFKGT